jgi:CheY-like chemotaxis protein
MEPRSVLIIDDNEATRTGLVQLLTLRGYRTSGAADGRDGLTRLRSDRSVGVIILDLGMPIADGYWFRERQLADPSIAHIPLIVFTGASEEQLDPAALVGADILHKPVGIPQLLDRIAFHCGMGLV